MPYVKDTLIARRGYSGMGDSWWENLLGGTAKGYTTGEAQQTQAAIDTQRALAAQSGVFGGLSITTVAMLGGAAFLAFKLLKKKR